MSNKTLISFMLHLRFIFILLNQLAFYLFIVIFHSLDAVSNTPAALLMLWLFRVIMVHLRSYIVHGKEPSNYNITILFQYW